MKSYYQYSKSHWVVIQLVQQNHMPLPNAWPKICSDAQSSKGRNGPFTLLTTQQKRNMISGMNNTLVVKWSNLALKGASIRVMRENWQWNKHGAASWGCPSWSRNSASYLMCSLTYHSSDLRLPAVSANQIKNQQTCTIEIYSSA